MNLKDTGWEADRVDNRAVAVVEIVVDCTDQDARDIEDIRGGNYSNNLDEDYRESNESR